jgi:DNA-binding MarR family transcriptional regulator
MTTHLDYPPAGSLEGIVRCIEAYRRRVSSHSLLSFELFLLVAERNPISPTDLCRTLDLARGVVSGAIATIGEGSPSYRRTTDPPPRLISSVMHPANAAAKLLGLTPKGSHLAAEMRAMLGKVPGELE